MAAHQIELSTNELEAVVVALIQDASYWYRLAAGERTPDHAVERLQGHAREIELLVERLRRELPPGAALPRARSLDAV